MTPPRPRFSIVSAVYDVEPYLAEFIASIEDQRFDLGQVEVIVVDDGSTDGSGAILDAWAARRPDLVTVLRQPNAGQGSARNLGLERATGEWVTFTDPDDRLDRDFFRVAAHFADNHPDVEVMASKPFILEDGQRHGMDRHPRREQYERGNRRVDLEAEPNTFTGSSTVSLFRLDRIRALGLRFDPRIRPNFEDGHFAVCYLLGLERPVVGVLRDAGYLYRKRGTGDSTLQRSLRDPRRYSDVFRFGYLDVLDRARARYGSIPAWLQQVIVYELSWYLSADEKATSDIQMSSDLASTFHELFADVVRQLDSAVVERHAVRPMKSIWTDILTHGCRDADWHSPVAARTKVDPASGLQRVCYRYIGAPPVVDFLVDSVRVEPAHGKVMAHRYYGRVLMRERIAWLPIAGKLELTANAMPIPIRRGGWPTPDAPGSGSLTRRLGVSRHQPLASVARSGLRRIRRGLDRLSAAPMRWLARSRPFRSTYGDAWVLMDRVHNADDNGERLFEYLRAERPDINAWFVLERDTPDWKRMRAAGITRLVAYGSFRWTMLMLNSAWLLSSHADRAVAKPQRVLRITGGPTWRFAFLNHGVIKDDLSLWLNRRDIDFFVVSTTGELESIAADDTCYLFTTKETHDTGLPRFDRLLARARKVEPGARDLVIIAPTWRTWLTDYVDPDTQRRAIDPAYWDSVYHRQWSALLASPDVAAAAARRGWRIAFMPHPNMQAILAAMDLPAHVERLAFTGNDVQDLYARCALLVTDYSSVAFNIAYLDGPVVYFQFDRDQMFGGGHVGRQGYFDYVRDGFGPVAIDAADAVAAVVASIDDGPRPSPTYQSRIDRTFVQRDGRACARVVAAIEALDRPSRPLAEGPRP